MKDANIIPFIRTLKSVISGLRILSMRVHGVLEFTLAILTILDTWNAHFSS